MLNNNKKYVHIYEQYFFWISQYSNVDKTLNIIFLIDDANVTLLYYLTIRNFIFTSQSYKHLSYVYYAHTELFFYFLAINSSKLIIETFYYFYVVSLYILLVQVIYAHLSTTPTRHHLLKLRFKAVGAGFITPFGIETHLLLRSKKMLLTPLRRQRMFSLYEVRIQRGNFQKKHSSRKRKSKFLSFDSAASAPISLCSRYHYYIICGLKMIHYEKKSRMYKPMLLFLYAYTRS